MKYLKKFETETAYNTFKASQDYITPNVSLVTQDNKVHYNPWTPHDYSQDYFTMVVTTGGDVTWTGTSNNALSYSTDNGATWSTASSSITLSVNEGDKVLWKGTPTPQLNQGIGTFSGDTDVRYSVEGNAMSLLFGDNFKGQTSLSGKDYALYYLFNNNINITSAENLSLPATTLASNCYQSMFTYCINLTTAPELPATTLASCCYSSMFKSCTSLTTAPELPAATLADYCYKAMFLGCTSLTTAPELPATTLAINCCENMFRDCTNLTTAPELPATMLAGNCYQSMFLGCTSLTTAPELPATTLADNCCNAMFHSCTNLTKAPELPATTLARRCYYSMFYKCTNLTTAPELPATMLAGNCYQSMFQNCTNLNSITCLATNISASNCTANWVNGVAATGTFTKNASMSSWTTGVNGIPSGWTVVDAA